MHFRFRGNNIQVVKSQPEASTGKAKSIPVGSINRATLALTDKLRENCTSAELKEIETFVRHCQAVDALKRKHAALTLPEQMAAAVQWFKEADLDEAREIAEGIMQHSAVLRKVLSKRGLI